MLFRSLGTASAYRSGRGAELAHEDKKDRRAEYDVDPNLIGCIPARQARQGEHDNSRKEDSVLVVLRIQVCECQSTLVQLLEIRNKIPLVPEGDFDAVSDDRDDQVHKRNHRQNPGKVPRTGGDRRLGYVQGRRQTLLKDWNLTKITRISKA